MMVSPVFDLSVFAARDLSGGHIAPKAVRDETDSAVTGDPEDEISGEAHQEMHSPFACPSITPTETLAILGLAPLYESFASRPGRQP